MPEPQMIVRPAEPADLGVIVSLTRQMRSRLARWAPVYFHPADGAEDLHAAFLEFAVGADEHATWVLCVEDDVVGFFMRIIQPDHVWVDDLCITDDRMWPAAISTIDGVISSRWVTCVSTSDTPRSSALHRHGLLTVSSYWARTTTDASPSEPTVSGQYEFEPSSAPCHTFGGRPFAPDVPGALVIVDESRHLIGSPPMTPPIYDPGGPTTVIDQIAGPDRRGLLEEGINAACARGDAQVVVVGDASDVELAEMLASLGFQRVVDLIGSPRS